MPLNQSKHAPLTSVATSAAMDSRPDLSSPYHDETASNGWATPTSMASPVSPYTPGLRSALARRGSSNDHILPSIEQTTSSGEIQMQSFQEGLPPPPPVSHSWKRIDRWAEDNYTELWDQLGEGCTVNDLNELEHQLDASLPIEVRESLQCHDGQERGGRPTGIIFGCMLLDCEEIVQEYRNWKLVNEEYLIPTATPNSNERPLSQASSSKSPVPQGPNPFWRQELLEKQDSQPPRAIQKAYAHPGWIPLARDWGGNNLAVDLAPGPAGKWGQVIIFGRDFDCKVVVARSWSAFLATVADDISSQKVFVDEDTHELKLKEFKAEGVEPAYLDILRWRMDQKYGRRIPKKKAPNGIPPAPRNGSPYGSPTEERGRSPNRVSARGSSLGMPSPRVGPMPSPLSSQIQQDSIAKPVAIRGDRNVPKALETHVASTAKPEKLVEVPTPGLAADEPKLDKLVSVTPTTAELPKESAAETDLKVLANPNETDDAEMKDVAI